MTEAEIERIPMNQLFDKYDIALQFDDVVTALEIEDSEGRELLGKLKRECPNDNDISFGVYISNFLNKYEKHFSKTTLLMATLENRINNLKFNVPDSSIKTGEFIKKLKEVLSGVNKNVHRLVIDSEGKVSIDTLSAKKLVTGKTDTKNQEKLAELEKNGLELKDLLDFIMPSDLPDIICSEELGELLRYQVFRNAAVTKNISMERLENIANTEDEINELSKQIGFDDVIKELEPALKQSLEYIDFDKLVLCGAYRILEFLDRIVTTSDDVAKYAERLRKIKAYLEKKKVVLKGKIMKHSTRDATDQKQKITKGDINYNVKDFERDMESFDGDKFWGNATKEEEKGKLLLGETQLTDATMKRIRFSRDEISYLAVLNEENYIYLLQRGVIKETQVQEINAAKGHISNNVLMKLYEIKALDERGIIGLYLEQKCELSDIQELQLDFRTHLSPQDILAEYEKEDNDEKKNRISKLYQAISLGNEEQKQESKDEVFDIYLDTMDGRYLEVFLGLGTLTYEDLEGVMDSSEWVEAYQEGQISYEFLTKLQEHRLIDVADIRRDETLVDNELKAWEEGKISSETIGKLGLTVEELLTKCDEGKIKGKSIVELISKDEMRRLDIKIISNYTYGVYNTIRPALAAYNGNIVNRDKTIEIINGMKVPSKEVAKLCAEGMLSGLKIAELRYKGIISKRQFAALKENGLVSDEEEIDAANNLTPEEMLQELESNGCKRIQNINSILERLPGLKQGHRKRRDVPTLYDKKILNPVIRNEILEIIGTDTTVTTPENGFNGYQAFIIPKLGVAVLERLFRENKEEVKPTYGDATYICEIGKYIQVSGQSKREVKDFMNGHGLFNGNVEIRNHTNGWGSNLLDAISKVNPNIIIIKSKGKIKSISRGEEELDIDIEKLNSIIDYMRQGKYSLSLEEYE